ncbi:MAG: chemotaxis response regulator protein-glutamate methylesterase [Candidatus Kapaibacterium sp.]
MDKIRVLIVDDSAFMRATLSKMLASNEHIEVVGTAPDGKVAVEKALALSPDVITMDIEMPVLNGIDATKEIMEKCPTNIVMVSTLTSEGAELTIDALHNGAIDFITKKPAFTEVHGMKEELISKIIEVGTSDSLRNKVKRGIQLNKNLKIQKSKDGSSDAPSQPAVFERRLPSTPSASSTAPTGSRFSAAGSERQSDGKSHNIKLVCIGISTGGPISLQKVIPKLPSNFPVPVLIIQHMPPVFTKSLAERLNNLSKIKVKEAENGDVLQKGCAYLSPGGRQMELTRNGVLKVSDGKDPGQLYNPSVNVTVQSAIDQLGGSILGVIMTGMGHDGQEALTRLHQLGGYVIAQSVDSCVVAGMTESVINANAASEIVDLDKIAERICRLLNVSIATI